MGLLLPAIAMGDLVLTTHQLITDSQLLGDSSGNNLALIEANSRLIFTTDLLAFKRDRKSSSISLAFHAVAVTLILLLTLKAGTSKMRMPALVETHVYMRFSVPPIILPVSRAMGGGGGGGAHDVVEVSRGHQPIVATKQITPPQIIRIDRLKLGIEPSEMVKMPDDNTQPNLGMAKSPQIALASQGGGSGSGFGQGLGGGIGMGRGTGAGPGTAGGYGGGVMSVGGGVSAPLVLHSADPEFTDDARRANYQGSVSIKLIVDSQGNPQDIRLASHLGMGLEEKAVEAVKQYKFRPAMYLGHPVAVQIVIVVDFHLH